MATSALRIWFHVPNESRLAPVEELAARLGAELPEAEALITVATLPARTRRSHVTYVSPPADKRPEAQAFLEDWKPSAVVWLGAALQTSLLAEVEARKVPCFMADARASDIVPPRAPWRRMRMKAALRGFSRLLAVDEADADGLKALGARPWHVEIAGPLQAGAIALDHNEAERAFLAEALATRPIWYAADLPIEELTLALDAHRQALRHAHRFLMVISPAASADAPAMAEAARERGFRVVCRSETDEVDPEDQVLIADIPGEHGLWYRLAPVSYVGGTLSDGRNRNPFEPAALGSAIVHGPRIRRFAENFARLKAAAASREVAGPAELGPMLAELSTPDQSARLAHDAWDVSSRGAEVTDRIVSLVSRAVRDG